MAKVNLINKKENETKIKINFKEILNKMDIENFIGNKEYGFKLNWEPKMVAIIELNIEHDIQKWQHKSITYYNNLKTTKPYNNGVYFEIIPNYKELLEYKNFMKSADNVMVVLEQWFALLKIMGKRCTNYINEILTSLYNMGEDSEEFKKFAYYIPRVKHNSLSVCLPVLPCYLNIQYNYFKVEKEAFRHWCINIGVTLFLEALLENPYNYKELYFKHIIGMTSSSAWDAKAYKIINKALYRERALLLKYPPFYQDKLNLQFVSQLLLFDIQEKLQLKILLTLSKNKSIVSVGNVLSFVSDKLVRVDIKLVKNEKEKDAK